MKEGKDMLAVIPVADHTSVRSGALRRRDWNDLVKSLGYFINSSRKMNCSGVVIRPLSEVGYMLLEQDLPTEDIDELLLKIIDKSEK